MASSWPRERRWSATWDPIKPAPPVRRTLILDGAPINLSLSLSFSVPFVVPLGEPLDGARETLFGRDARLPAKSFPCSRDVRAALHGIVLREWFIDELALALALAFALAFALAAGPREP